MGGSGPQIVDVTDLRCPPNSYFTKIKTRSANLVDKIELWCSDGTRREKGGEGGSENPTFECPQGFDQIKFRAGSNIDSIQVRCSNGIWSDRWGGTGGSEIHRSDCYNTQQVLTGLNSIGTRDGKLAAGTDIEKTLECGNRVNCLDDANLFHNECKFRTDNSYKAKLQEYCNRNDTNAKSSGCVTWCDVVGNRNSCTLLADLNDCAKYGIARPDCTRTKINNIISNCEKYKIIQSSVGGTGIYPCNVNAINQLEKECKEYGISLDNCSPDSLENEKNRALDIALKQEAERNAAARYNSTQQSINQVLGISSEPSPTPVPKSKDEDYILYIIIAIIIILLSSSSSLGIGFILMSDQE